MNKRDDLLVIGKAKGLKGPALSEWVSAMDRGGAISEARIREDGIPVDNRNIRGVDSQLSEAAEE